MNFLKDESKSSTFNFNHAEVSNVYLNPVVHFSLFFYFILLLIMLCIKENSQLAMDRKQVIKRKVMAIGKISRVYNVLKENPELINQLKTLSFNGKIPAGILTKGEQGIKEGKLN